MRLFLSYLFFIFFIFSCQEKQDNAPLVLELNLYSLDKIDEEYEKGKLKFAERFKYNDKRQVIEHDVLDDNGKFKNTEKYIYSSPQESESQYYDAVGRMISRYEHSYDEDGNKLETKSYDGTNDELLRIEKFTYDNKKNLKTKSVFEASGKLVRTFNFEYDAYNNETQVQVLNPDGSQIMIEEYRITKYNDQKHWVEKWGLRNDEPISFRHRTLLYPKN